MTYQYFDNFNITDIIRAEITALEKIGAFYQLNEHSKNEWDIFAPMLWNGAVRFLNVGWSIPSNFGAQYLLAGKFAFPFITAVGVVDELRKFYANLEVRVHFGDWEGWAVESEYQVLPTTDAELIQFILTHQ